MLASRVSAPGPLLPTGSRRACWLRSTSVPNVSERIYSECAPDPLKFVVPEDRPRVVGGRVMRVLQWQTCMK